MIKKLVCIQVWKVSHSNPPIIDYSDLILIDWVSTIIICLISSLWLIKLSVHVRTWITWEQTSWHWGTRSAWTKWASVNLKMRLRLPVNIFSVKCKVVDRAVNRTFPSHWIIFAFIIYQIFRFSCGHSTQGSWLVIFLQVKIFDPKLTKQKITGKLPVQS